MSAPLPRTSALTPRRGITVATDAAVNHACDRVGSGFVATSGLYGAAAHYQPPGIVGPETVTVAELRAVWRAVQALNDGPHPRARIVVLGDSENALRYLAAWKNGQVRFPDGYLLQAQRASGRRSSLEQLAEQLQYDGQRYRFVKVAAHAGHHLNEAADSLARLGLRTGTGRGVQASELEAAADTIVTSRLGDYWTDCHSAAS